eukprot:jgi/Botrbrau1/15432/Bobra.43_2s0057.1
MGHQLIEVEHIGEWRFLMFHGTLNTKMYVRQNRRTHTLEFQLKEAGFMKDFAGKWTMEPFTQDTLDHIYGPAKPELSWFSPVRALRTLSHFMPHRSEASLITLEQSVQPAVHVPPPLDRFLRGIAASQVKSMLTDLRAEVKRLKAEEQDKRLSHHHSPAHGQVTTTGKKASVAPALLTLTFFN